jgi:GNAT superfamily N-acetyltransferase
MVVCLAKTRNAISGGSMLAKGFKLRRAGLKDLDILAYQRREMFVDMGVFTKEEAASGDKEYKRWVKEKFRKKKYIAFLIEKDDGKVVAGGSLWLKECQPSPFRTVKYMPYVMAVYTEREYRGQGLASRIVKESIKWAKEKGYPRVELRSSPQGKGLYKRHGFKKTNDMRYSMNKR